MGSNQQQTVPIPKYPAPSPSAEYVGYAHKQMQLAYGYGIVEKGCDSISRSTHQIECHSGILFFVFVVGSHKFIHI